MKFKKKFFIVRFINSIIERFFGICKDISNFLYIRKIINKNKDSKQWKEFRLRVDWINRIYTVINLRAEDFGDTDELIRENRYKERAEPLYYYLTSLNLHEILIPRITHVKDTYSYLIVFSQQFDYLTIKWLFATLFKITVAIFTFKFLNNIFNLEYFWNLLIQFLHDKKILR